MAGAFGAAFAFSAEVRNSRSGACPASLYRASQGAELKEQMLMDNDPVEMGYAKRVVSFADPCTAAEEGVRLPPIYIQQYLYPALRRYFAGKPPASLSKLRAGLPPCVLSGTSGACLSGLLTTLTSTWVTDIITLYLLLMMRCGDAPTTIAAPPPGRGSDGGSM